MLQLPYIQPLNLRKYNLGYLMVGAGLQDLDPDALLLPVVYAATRSDTFPSAMAMPAKGSFAQYILLAGESEGFSGLPVMYAAAGLERNTAAIAMSHLRPTLFKGMVSFIAASISSGVPGRSFAKPEESKLFI